MFTTNYSPTVTVIEHDGEAFVKLSDLEKVVRQAAPQGQYEMFQESYLYAFLRQAKIAAQGDAESAPQTINVR